MSDNPEGEPARQRFWQKINEVREQNRDGEIDEAQLEWDIDIEEAVREVRREIYEKWIGSSAPDVSSAERNEQ